VEPEPWHDPALPLDERLRLAEEKPLARRLMAAMAQLDCGACGYVCRTYSEAIAQGTETSLTLCSPGGSETAKALKQLVKAKPATNGHAANGTEVLVAPKVQSPYANGHTESGWSRRHPFAARVLKSVVLNRPGSEKETRHVEIDLQGGPSYEVGDALGLYPENCDDLIAELIEALGAHGDEPVISAEGVGSSLRGALACLCNLAEINEDLLGLLAATASDNVEAENLRRLIVDDSAIAGFDILDLLRAFPSARPEPAEFVGVLGTLMPRLYSISSSPRRHSGQVHLTVRRVSYEFGGRTRKGVASTMLADRVEPGSAVRVFVQKAHNFGLPADPRASLIMIGPGTGIAPFRAFLHEREAVGATGKNWLFYGDQRSAFDFLYESELSEFLERGVLTHLDTAFSRDQDAKIYVQHRLLERGATLYQWLEDGAYLYVCGDAKRMAVDVDRALRTILRDHGRMSEESASVYITRLTSAGRYCRDVY
jgi:sulfite reductase (NADPH) flavoprotein alpha-component